MSYTQDSLNHLHAKAVANFHASKRILQQLKKLKPNKLDKIILNLHTREFAKIHCLECANCCKTISPAIYDRDIRRMALALKTKVSEFIDDYLLEEKEGEYALKTTPCPFLDENNFCEIYESRPKACREYPHTNRKRFYQILDLTAHNSKVCPAVFNMIEELRKIK